jgi:hypothetical protein
MGKIDIIKADLDVWNSLKDNPRRSRIDGNYSNTRSQQIHSTLDIFDVKGKGETQLSIGARRMRKSRSSGGNAE